MIKIKKIIVITMKVSNEVSKVIEIIINETFSITCLIITYISGCYFYKLDICGIYSSSYTTYDTYNVVTK